MDIKKTYICLSTRLIYFSVIIILLIAILFTLFPLNELFVKKEITNNTPIITPANTIPTDVPTPTLIPRILFPDNADAQKAYLILLYSPYFEQSVNMYLYEGDKTDYFRNQTVSTYVEYQGTQQDEKNSILLDVTFPAQAVGGILNRLFKIDIGLMKVAPVYSDKKDILNPSFTKVPIPHTNKSFMIPDSFKVINGENLSFEQNSLAANAYLCGLGDWRDIYCKKLQEYLGRDAEVIAERYFSGHVTTLKWEGLPHEWALDHVAWQGSTYRETMNKYSDFLGSVTITLGNNNFYKIGQGCCGDNSFSYLTKGFDENGASVLITFTIYGYHEENIKKHPQIQTYPYLEEILKTMN